jgi:hypothetical protein
LAHGGRNAARRHYTYVPVCVRAHIPPWRLGLVAFLRSACALVFSVAFLLALFIALLGIGPSIILAIILANQ